MFAFLNPFSALATVIYLPPTSSLDGTSERKFYFHLYTTQSMYLVIHSLFGYYCCCCWFCFCCCLVVWSLFVYMPQRTVYKTHTRFDVILIKFGTDLLSQDVWILWSVKFRLVFVAPGQSCAHLGECSESERVQKISNITHHHCRASAKTSVATNRDRERERPKQQ